MILKKFSLGDVAFIQLQLYDKKKPCNTSCYHIALVICTVLKKI